MVALQVKSPLNTSIHPSQLRAILVCTLLGFQSCPEPARSRSFSITRQNVRHPPTSQCAVTRVSVPRSRPFFSTHR
jgi:hypothetical protein